MPYYNEGDDQRLDNVRRVQRSWDALDERRETVSSRPRWAQRESPEEEEKKEERKSMDDESLGGESSGGRSAAFLRPEVQPEDDGEASAKSIETLGIRDLAFQSIQACPVDEGGHEDQLALLRCVLYRSKTIWGAELTLLLEATGQELLVAKRRQRSGNYHIFDMSCGRVGRRLSKKGGNYVGKIAAASKTQPSHRILVDHSAGDKRTELALFMHRRTKAFSALMDGAKPRQICVALPGDDVNAKKKPLLSRFLVVDNNLVVLNQRPPRLVNGQYSLNFHGRATVASVKNCQLVVDGCKDVVFQLGKIGADKFNLDFAAPFTPLVAFALAVSQFIG